MGRTPRTVWLAAAALWLSGCSTGPLQDNPLLIRIGAVPQENPLYLPYGPESYAKLYEKALDLLDDIWEIAYADRFTGRIETHPAIAPGVEQPWRPGSPDFRQRLLAFLQTIRHRCILNISLAENGGYYVEIKVLKELEDLPVPMRSTAGQASFRINSTIERQFEVIEPPIYEPFWMPIGRDYKLEQVLLERLAHTNFKNVPNPKPIYGP